MQHMQEVFYNQHNNNMQWKIYSLHVSVKHSSQIFEVIMPYFQRNL